MPAFLAGGGVTGALIRSIDWSQTPLGPVAGWPASLENNRRHHAALAPSDVPVVGPGAGPVLQRRLSAELRRGQAPGGDGAARRRLLAGDLADHLAADRRRDAARRGRAGTKTIWCRSSATAESKRSTGPTAIRRSSTRAARVGGTLVVCTETTARVISERRLRTLRAFVEGTVLAANAGGGARAAAAETLASEPGGRAVRAVLHDRRRHGRRRPGPCGRHRRRAAARRRRRRARPRRRAVGVIPCAAVLPRRSTASGSPWPEPVSRVFVARDRVAQASTAPSGYVVFGLSPRLPFDAGVSRLSAPARRADRPGAGADRGASPARRSWRTSATTCSNRRRSRRRC